jgi:AraC-like DNA-binding protein
LYTLAGLAVPNGKAGRFVMAHVSVREFVDPEQYQAAIRPSHVEILVPARGDFHADLKHVEFPRLWLQRANENLPRIVHATVTSDRPPVFFLTAANHAPLRHKGRNLAFGEIVVEGSGSAHHYRSEGLYSWATMSLTRHDLAAAGNALTGRELGASTVTEYLRPSRPLISRLLKLHHAVAQLADSAPELLEQAEPARALEQALLQAMISCLAQSAPDHIGRGVARHTTIIARFEEVLEANYGRPLHLAEICAAVGASERTLRVSCMEHLGMGPVRYLWLRRMHLARRSLIQTAPGAATVTKIATANGFWELGRFAVEYGALFGEAPSASLRRPAQEIRISRNRPFAFVDSEYA